MAMKPVKIAWQGQKVELPALAREGVFAMHTHRYNDGIFVVTHEPTGCALGDSRDKAVARQAMKDAAAFARRFLKQFAAKTSRAWHKHLQGPVFRAELQKFGAHLRHIGLERRP